MNAGEDLFGAVYEKGKVIYKQDDSGDSLYIIQSGAVEVSHKRGEENVSLCILEKGEFFGEVALLPDHLRLTTVKAIERTRLLCFTREALLEKMRQDSGVSLHLLRGIILRIHQSSQKVREVAVENETLRLALGMSQELSPGALISKMVSTGTKDFQGILWNDISVKDISKIWNAEGNEEWVEQGQVIFEEGESAKSMFFVAQGSIEVSIQSGKEKCVLTTLGPGGFFGEMATISGCKRTATALATSKTLLVSLSQDEFFEKIRKKPELALHILQSLILRLRRQNALLANPYMASTLIPQNWGALVSKKQTIKIAMISLSSCSGCSAVLIDDPVFDELLKSNVEIVYCPMLLDQDEIPEVDIALVEGAVRLKDDVNILEEARNKSRILIAWGTCAATGGVPAMANRFELEELIEETYGMAHDAFSYYLSGKGGIDLQTTYQERGVSLLRRARNLENYVRVDFFLAGCPPQPRLLMDLISEMNGEKFPKVAPVVCAECGRKVTRNNSNSLQSFSASDDSNICFVSNGMICLGFLTRGGCGGVCTKNGLSCWGCRGPSDMVFKKLYDGSSYGEVVIDSLTKRCNLERKDVRKIAKKLQQQEYGLFSLRQDMVSNEINKMRVR
ncbi:MAG: cyclic nucleotide-binding domain-containing protein [Proteobacteria bacterium]|nr:cyclic nucleotide-binding domain-containing protein [Pseudomonadota bacterium]MBU1709293.1 cyclic nucleotide-binding domain-containing protein [Pseudomonadota bacterium]